MIAAKYPQYVARIAVGLVGHGSECYGFDDAYSQDHDFGPRFCLWLSDEDYTAIGEQLQTDYDALPRDFSIDAQGHAVFSTNTSAIATDHGTPSPATPRAQGANRRDGVFRIGDFFESITGYRTAPAQTSPHEWLMLDEPHWPPPLMARCLQTPPGNSPRPAKDSKICRTMCDWH